MALYAHRPDHLDAERFVWYHTMDLPDRGEMAGAWDLRDGIDDYIGGVDVSGERVLEIGPASGYVSVELERRGADVVVAEVSDERSWDFVPQAALDIAAITALRREHIADLKSTWWYVQEATTSHARAYYGDVENLPDELGRFDTSFLLAVLLHCRNPVAIVESVARLTDRRMVVTEPAWADPALGDAPVCTLVPSAENGVWDTWWLYTPEFFVQLLGVMGFVTATVTFHTQGYQGAENRFFTVTAERLPA